MSVLYTSAAIVDIDASLIATVHVIASDDRGNTMTVRAMSDGGSHMNMVSQRLVQRLKLTRIHRCGLRAPSQTIYALL